MAYFNQYYNDQRYSNQNGIPKNYQVPGYYRNNTPSFQSPQIPKYNTPEFSNSLQTQGLSFNQGPGGEQQEQGGGVSAGQIAGYADSALNGIAEGQQSTDNFSIDPHAGYKGSVKGLASGGVAGAIIGGISNQIGTFSQVNKNLKNLDTGVQGYQTDPEGNVIYQGDSFTSADSKLTQLKAGEKSINKSLDPATFVFSGLFGTRKKIKRAKRRLEANRLRAQQDYNTAKDTSNARRLSRESYDQSMNNYNRIYNLYNR